MKIVEELQVAKLKAEESDQLKSAFLLNLSHEIRTPMNGILGFTSLLNQEGLSGEEQQRYIGIIQKSGTRMINTVTDLVQISQIETGQVDVILKEVNVIELANRIYETYISDAEEKGLKLIKQFSKNEEILLETDSTKLETILKNLLSNAIKYTESGTIEIGFQQNEKESIKFLEFYVSDTGIGIPEHKRNAIFNRFEQADVRDKKAKQGSGLGLSIAQAYVKKLGGDIWLESNEKKGTTFYFTIPIVHHSDEIVLPNKLETNDSLKTRVHKIKVLLAEDDEFSAMHISILLEEVTTKIILAKNGVEAIELFQKNPDIDLILMDIRMPQMDGYEATRKIRELNKEVVIIAQTANALLGDSDKALAVGCNDYIAKPINKDLLFAKIEKWMES